MTAPTAAPPAAPPPAPPPERGKFIDWRLPITYVAGLAITFALTVGSWAIRTDNQVGRQAERIDALEKRTMSASEQAYELRNIAGQLAEVNKKLADLAEIQKQIVVMDFRIGNAEYALGLTAHPNRKAPGK
ncbi:hypothetical protein [uncultured Pseudacidovorax sp.]|uniref:hypothetical protein n=1 Tax=uncultured Pseudacidovorax sp. TaxID=679313 RepID=UPI0025D0B857|nr:hypothetical protein [uncultured Pseudacidovorax sp.]